MNNHLEVLWPIGLVLLGLICGYGIGWRDGQRAK
jgi:hypothetical protein